MEHLNEYLHRTVNMNERTQIWGAVAPNSKHQRDTQNKVKQATRTNPNLLAVGWGK
jgi:hypothetical protein